MCVSQKPYQLDQMRYNQIMYVVCFHVTSVISTRALVICKCKEQKTIVDEIRTQNLPPETKPSTLS